MSHIVHPGDRGLPAAQLNRAFAATDKVLSGGGGIAGARSSQPFVWVKNNSGADVDQFGILGVDGLVIEYADNNDEFKNNIVIDGNDPAIDDHLGKFVVTLEPIIDGAVGRAVMRGHVQCQVNVVIATDEYADVLDADPAKLGSGPTGSARIVHKPSGTGTKWCLVELGLTPPPCRLRVHTVSNDYLVCHTWDGTTEGSTAINVAKPFKLRHVAGNYPNVSAVVTVNANAITATIGGDDEEWVLPDELTYTDNDEIYAIPVASTGVTVSSKDLKLLDMNVDGRAWIKEE